MAEEAHEKSPFARSAAEKAGDNVPEDAARRSAEHEHKLTDVDAERAARDVGDGTPEAVPALGGALQEHEALRDLVKEGRNRIKDAVKKLEADFVPTDRKKILRQMEVCYPYVSELCRLTKRFAEIYRQKKREKNLIDFSDQEHFALEILVTKDEEGRPVRTEAAEELQAGFRAVMCDEYQDSNAVQELLLWSVSREEKQNPNRFMVGDVKQSIYGFRMARPDIFLEKDRLYGLDDSRSCRIDLSGNYRSRFQVLDFANFLFGRLMSAEMGGIAYDERQTLKAMADYPEDPDTDYTPEILLLDQAEAPSQEEEEEGGTREEAEALAVARRIQELMRTMRVYDKDLDTLRPLAFRDIVILLRNAKGKSETYASVLQKEGIPAHASARIGYFSAPEVVLVLNFLRILDNPRQDIPLAAVLLSPVCGFTSGEMARLRINTREGCLFSALETFADAQEEASDTGRKAADFLRLFRRLREDARVLPVYRLLETLYEKTGLPAWVSAMPGGDQRRANLEMLVTRAAEYGKTSYHGLFSFIRYIRELEKYDVDEGEANIFSENADTVRILSVHKSKGLEYPVVFLCGTGNGFNLQDAGNSLLLDDTLGIGLKAVNLEKRVAADTVIRKYIAERIKKKLLGEELRVLYVAVTRAREKLIITGVVKSREQLLKKCTEAFLPETGPLPAAGLLSGSCFMEWIISALYGQAALAALGPETQEAGRKEAKVKIRAISARAAMPADMEANAEKTAALERILSAEPGTVCHGEAKKILEEMKAFAYPFAGDAGVPEKVSVSELKKAGRTHDPESDGTAMFPEEVPVPCVPAFVSREKPRASGSFKGTAFHQVMRFLDYARLPEGPVSFDDALEEAKLQTEDMLKKGLISPEQAEAVNPADVAAFLASDIGTRMKTADRNGTLKREQPFMLSLPARTLSESWQSEEAVVIQGIIDACFIEKGGYVILDYKTDRLTAGDGQELVDKYALQLHYYEQAVQKGTGLPVREKVIYSTALSACIIL